LVSQLKILDSQLREVDPELAGEIKDILCK